MTPLPLQLPCSATPSSSQRLRGLAVIALVVLVFMTEKGQCADATRSLRRTVDNANHGNDDDKTLRNHVSKQYHQHEQASKKQLLSQQQQDEIQTRELQTSCTCNSCTEDVLNTDAGGATCGQRIAYLQTLADGFPDEVSACYQVAGLEHHDECGACDPSTCDGRGQDVETESFCGCKACTYSVWMSSVESSTCAGHVNWRQEVMNEYHATACSAVATEFASVCGACDPTQCTEDPAPRCGCDSCDDSTWNAVADTFTCGERIQWADRSYYMTQKDACRLVAQEQFPTICGPACDPDACTSATRAETVPPTAPVAPKPSPQPVASPTTNKNPTPAPVKTPAPIKTTPAPVNAPVKTTTPAPFAASSPTAPTPTSTSSTHCGCNDCTAAVWNTLAGDATCGARINWVMKNKNMTEEEACIQVAHFEFSDICGKSCDPQLCDGRVPSMSDLYLYCFPPPGQRVTYNNVWNGGYTMEVKEDPAGGACGPGNNVFSKSAVSFRSNELTLEYKRQNGQWIASEVRLYKDGNNEAFSYGTYKFSIKSIQVIRNNKKVISSSILPASLILGLFTWDPTENYNTHENYNHEVDVEISRWDVPNDFDAQFLVQPPEQPQWFRFSTKNAATGKIQEAGHTYEFTWNPGQVNWSTTAGGGVTHSYSTAQANALGLPDRVQCLPANMEVRMNLWNLRTDGTVSDLQNNDRVKVVIDNFSYTPSGLTHVKDGQACSKDCQCASGSYCVNGVCDAI